MARAKTTPGRPRKPKEAEHEVAFGQRVTGDIGSNTFYSRRYGAALDMNVISRALQNADAGRPAAFHDILNELRQKVPDLHSVLQIRELALLGKGYSIRAYRADGAKKSTRRQEKVAAHVRWALARTKKLRRSIAHLLDATFKGYSVCEIDWEICNGKVVPRELRPVAGRRWGHMPDERLVFTDDGHHSPGWDVLAEYPHRFVVHAPRVNGDIAPREGLGRVLVWMAAFSNKGWRDWLMLSQQFALPERIVRLLKDKADNDDRIAAEQIADAGITSGSTLCSNAIEIETRWPDTKGTAGSTPAEPLINKAKEGMALVTIGQLGTTSDVKGGLGATGGNQERVRSDIVDADNDAISETLTEQLIRWIVFFEFGPDEPLPTFSFDVEEAADAKALAEALQIYVGLGLSVPQAYVHDVTGIPAPAPGEAVLTKAPAPDPTGAGSDPNAQDGADAADGDAAEQAEPTDDTEDQTDEEMEKALTTLLLALRRRTSARHASRGRGAHA